VLRGAQTYGLRLDQLHSDVTRLAFEGAYDGAPTTTADGRSVPRITYGFTGKEDPTRRQLTLSLSVAADGAIPAWYQVADGNAADTRAYLGHLAAVRERLHLDRPLVVGDSKLVTRATVLGFCRVAARFVGPAGLADADRATLRRLWGAGEPCHRLDPPPAGQAPTAGRYWGLECPEALPDPERGAIYALRRLFVQSLDDRRAARHQRAKDLARARRALWTVKRRLRLPAYRDRRLVERKVAQAVAKVSRYLPAAVHETPHGLDVRWRLDRARLAEDAAFDGIYGLVTNLPTDEAPLRSVFRIYKEQAKVERRFRVTKQPPIQVRPVWLHQPRRIESLVFVVMFALFLFTLIEREARRVVAASGRVFAGLRPEGRDHLPVTAARLVEVLAPLSLIKQRLRVGTAVVDICTPATLTAIQAQLLDRLALVKPDSYLQVAVTPYPT
jgi:hypothetical protein